MPRDENMMCLGRAYRLQGGEDWHPKTLLYHVDTPTAGLGSVPRFWPFGRMDLIGKTK